jgi:hypothetical protein
MSEWRVAAMSGGIMSVKTMSGAMGMYSCPCSSANAKTQA